VLLAGCVLFSRFGALFTAMFMFNGDTTSGRHLATTTAGSATSPFAPLCDDTVNGAWLLIAAFHLADIGRAFNTTKGRCYFDFARVVLLACAT
jgi:hypothetical protein